MLFDVKSPDVDGNDDYDDYRVNGDGDNDNGGGGSDDCHGSGGGGGDGNGADDDNNGSDVGGDIFTTTFVTSCVAQHVLRSHHLLPVTKSSKTFTIFVV